MAGKPRVLVLGGLNTLSPALIRFLVPDEGDPLVSAIRIADKFSVNPPTTYLGSRIRRTLANPFVEYRQANLTVAPVVTSVFEPPEGQEPWDYVFDFSGDILYGRASGIQVVLTAQIVKNIGLEAARRKIRAYVRCSQPFYSTPMERGTAKESDPLVPVGVRGYWWHEAARALAAIPDLNLVIIRPGESYGPQLTYGTVHTKILLGRVYQHLGQDMKYMWSSDIKYNTIHSVDVANAMWACANWIAPIGRAKADDLAGEVLLHQVHKDQEVEDMIEAFLPTATKVIAPVFNVVDDSDTTVGTTAEVIGTVYGLRSAFYGNIASTAFRYDTNHDAEINNTHMTAWGDLIMNSNPPVPRTPLTVFVEKNQLAKFSIAYSNEKIKKIVGYQLIRPKFDGQAVTEIIESFQEEGVWPN